MYLLNKLSFINLSLLASMYESPSSTYFLTKSSACLPEKPFSDLMTLPNLSIDFDIVSK